MNDFTTSLKNFQAAQRKAAEKEKESIARARAHSGSHYVSHTHSVCRSQVIIDFFIEPEMIIYHCIPEDLS